MAEPMGVLSYTRKDDEFFGGYITAFGETLEAGVQVVTGDRRVPAVPGCRRDRASASSGRGSWRR